MPTDWWRRIWHLWRSEPLDERLDDEIQFHLDQEIAKNTRRGMTPEEARRRALLRFGGQESLKEQTRDQFRLAPLREFLRDMRLALRAFRRAPGFAAAAVLTLGLGIGASTAVFSVVHGVLLRPLPYPAPEHLVRLYQLGDTGNRMNVSDPNFRDWQTLTHSFAGMAEMAGGLVPVAGGSEPTMARVTMVSRDFFDVMRVRPDLGRSFTPNEHALSGEPAIIVSHQFWSRWLGAPAMLSDRALRFGERRYPIVGVMPEGFDYPGETAIWMPKELAPMGRAHEARTAHNYEVIARVRDDVPLPAAQAELSAVSRELKPRYGDGTWMADAAAVPLLDQLTATSRPAIQMLFAAAVLLLLIANTNVSSLLLARAAARRHEFAVQLAIGAGRSRLARLLLAEAAVICVAAGAIGTLIAIWSTDAITSFGAGAAPRLDRVRVDWVSLSFAIGISAVSAVALGLLTSLGIRDVQLSSALSDGHRTGMTSRKGMLARQSLIVAQVGMTLVLLAGAGLLGRSFLNVLTVNPGFRVDDALVLDFTLTSSRTEFGAVKARFLDAMLEGLSRLPGVSAVAMTSGFPLGGGSYSNGRFLEMRSLDELRSAEDAQRLSPTAIRERAGYAEYRVVSGDYFRTLGIPIVRGRAFGESDGPESPHVAVISESLAAEKWPDRDPIGRFVQFGNMGGDYRGLRIVGVVGDVRERNMEAAPGAVIYASYRQRPTTLWAVSVIVRGSDQAALVPQARRIVRELDPELPVEVRTVESAFEAALAGRRFSLVLIAAFGAAALVLATLGLYGLIAYVVSQRTREIGIRMALGATSRQLVTLIVARGALLAAFGCAAGLAVSLVLSRLVRGLLFGVSPTDPIVLGGVVLVTIAASIAASCIPAWRAARIQPVDTLRI